LKQNPFIFGFSTSLVIMILNRLVDAVQAFFGKPGVAETQVSAMPAAVGADKRSAAS